MTKKQLEALRILVENILMADTTYDEEESAWVVRFNQRERDALRAFLDER